jgi:hypothetical protein
MDRERNMATTATNDERDDARWARYERDGYLRLGRVLGDEDLRALQERIDAIMLGQAELAYDRLLMQLDSADGKYENAGVQSRGFKGRPSPTGRSRTWNTMRCSAHLWSARCSAICATGSTARTRRSPAFRAMFMNKPARQGTLLPWHQDRWTHLDRDPLITVWTALDPATRANGCVQVIPGSHKLGLINPSHPSAFLTDEQGRTHAPDERAEYLELDAGEAVLLHNWLLHRSDTNATDIPRRAFSVCYMDARTRATNGETYTPLFGAAAPAAA